MHLALRHKLHLLSLALKSTCGVQHFLALASQIMCLQKGNGTNGFKGALITQTLKSGEASIVLMSAVSAWWLRTSS